MQAVKDVVLFLTDGGIMMIPLLFSSILAVAIILERAFQLRRKKIISPNLLSMIDSIKESKDIDMARSVCNQTNSTLTNIMKVCLDNHKLDREELKELMEEQGRQEVRILERGLGALETIASASPLMGLLGTVIGMIKVFNVISKDFFHQWLGFGPLDLNRGYIDFVDAYIVVEPVIHPLDPEEYIGIRDT